MPSLQDRRDYRLEGAGYVSQMPYEEKIVGEEKRLFGRAGLNRLCISGLMHEAWCSRGRNQRFHNLFRKGGERMYWGITAGGILILWGVVAIVAVLGGTKR